MYAETSNLSHVHPFNTYMHIDTHRFARSVKIFVSHDIYICICKHIHVYIDFLYIAHLFTHTFTYYTYICIHVLHGAFGLRAPLLHGSRASWSPRGPGLGELRPEIWEEPRDSRRGAKQNLSLSLSLCIYIYIYLYVYIYTCICIYMCISCNVHVYTAIHIFVDM